MARRIYTVAGRAGTVVITDSKKNENGKGALYTFVDENQNTQLCAIKALQLCAIKALNDILEIVPRPNQMKFDQPVVFLLPRFIEFLRYEDTRKVWVTTGCKKNGEEIAPELLAEVKRLDKNVELLSNNIQLFGQRGLKSQMFIDYRDATWKIVDSMVPAPEKVSAMDAY